MAALVRVRTDAGPDALSEDVRTLLAAMLGWSADDLSLAPVGGGITNLLFRASRAVGDAEAVLVRVFGTGTDIIIDRARDNETTHYLGGVGFGPRLHGLFGNGRIEEFLGGAVPLEPQEMALTGAGDSPDYAALIAAQLARLHFLPPPAGAASEPVLWGQIARFLDLARATSFEGVSGEAAARSARIVAGINFEKATSDVAWLKDAITSLLVQTEPEASDAAAAALSSARTRARALACRTVFAHNDLLAFTGERGENERAPHLQLVYAGFLETSCASLTPPLRPVISRSGTCLRL